MHQTRFQIVSLRTYKPILFDYSFQYVCALASTDPSLAPCHFFYATLYKKSSQIQSNNSLSWCCRLLVAFWTQGTFTFIVGRTLLCNFTYNTHNIRLNYVAYENLRQQLGDGDQTTCVITNCVFSYCIKYRMRGY